MFLSLQFNQFIANFVQINLPDKKLLSGRNLTGKMVDLLLQFLVETLTGVGTKVPTWMIFWF